jgi:hypothetical protein
MVSYIGNLLLYEDEINRRIIEIRYEGVKITSYENIAIMLERDKIELTTTPIYHRLVDMSYRLYPIIRAHLAGEINLPMVTESERKMQRKRSDNVNKELSIF